MTDIGGTLVKAYLQLQRPGGGAGAELDRVTFQFNPKEYSIQKSASWESKPAKGAKKASMPEYKGAEPRSMTVEAFLDGTGEAPAGALTKAIETLFSCCVPLPDTLPKNKPSPPFVHFGWGGTVLFKAFVKQVSVKYTMFKPDGTPIRASASLTLQEVATPEEKQNPTSGSLATLRTHTVVSGDSLASIAYEEYGEATLWRALADANRLDDPMRLPAGTSLLIPPPEDAAAYA